MWLCSCAYDLRCIRDVPHSDSRCTDSVTSRASSCNSWSSWYRFSRPWLAFAFRRLCQPSTSLLVQTGWRNTDHIAGLQQPSTQVRRTYCRCSCTRVSPPADAICSSLRNSSPMTSAGRKHSACVLWQTRLMLSSFAYADCKPTDCTFLHTACEKWNAHPR